MMCMNAIYCKPLEAVLVRSLRAEKYGPEYVQFPVPLRAEALQPCH